MAMHARKPQRVNDGYFDKQQAHSYQPPRPQPQRCDWSDDVYIYPFVEIWRHGPGCMYVPLSHAKFNSKSERRAPSEYVSSESHYSPLPSPNGKVSMPGQSSHGGHGYHHYSHGSDERGYSFSRASYAQKSSTKDRDRNHKFSRDSEISPKEKRTKDSVRERSNHNRSDSEKKSRTRGVNNNVSRSGKYKKKSAATNVLSGSDWSEHISSSGKKYYYNTVSEISQWEKPKDWDSKRTVSKDSSYLSRNVMEVEKPTKKPSSSSGGDRYWYPNNREADGTERIRSKLIPLTYEDGPAAKDMDKSPERSTPFSDKSHKRRRINSIAHNSSTNTAIPPVVVLDNSNIRTGSLLAAALPKIVTTPILSVNNTKADVTFCETSGRVVNNVAAVSTPLRDAGPPTPTHSENTDPHAPPIVLETSLPRKMESLGTYSTVVGSLGMQATPMLTPSLANYYRKDLTNHVSGWPADLLEKQAKKYSEEAHQQCSLQCTRVSSELKCSRSLVRHMEIQATTQEQKLMYLRQQIKELEKYKAANPFLMND